MEDYTYGDLAQILQLNIENIKFEGDILSRLIAPTLRGNARAAAKMAAHISNYCASKGTNKITMTGWKELKHTLDIYINIKYYILKVDDRIHSV